MVAKLPANSMLNNHVIIPVPDAAHVSLLLAEAAHRITEMEIAVGQAVEFAQYVETAAKGTMVERAKHYLSLPYSQELAARLEAGK